MIIKNQHILINKLDIVDGQHDVHTYLLCHDCLKVSQIDFTERFNGCVTKRCPNCGCESDTVFNQLLRYGGVIRKVIDAPQYILFDKNDNMVDGFDIEQKCSIKPIVNGELSDAFDVTSGRDMTQFDLYIDNHDTMESCWMDNDDYNFNTEHVYTFNVSFLNTQFIESCRRDSDKQFRLDITYATNGHLCVSEHNVWLFLERQKQIVTIPKQLINLNSTKVHVYQMITKHQYRFNTTIDQIDTLDLDNYVDFINEVNHTIDEQSKQLLTKTDLYQYEYEQINKLTSRNLAIVAIYPNMYYLWKLTGFQIEPVQIWDMFNYMKHKRHYLKKEMSERIFIKRYFDIDLSKKEKQLIHDYPELLYLYNSFLQHIKHANYRLDLLQKINHTFKFDDSFGYFDSLKQMVRFFKYYFKTYFFKDKFDDQLDIFLYKLFSKSIDQYRDNTLIVAINDSQDLMRDIYYQLEIFVNNNVIDDGQFILDKFLNSKQTVQHFENDLIEYILEHHLLDTASSYEYMYSDKVRHRYNQTIDGWTFKLATSFAYLHYLSVVMHNCVGTSDVYHNQIVDDVAYIVHAFKHDQHMCILLDDTVGVLEALTKYNDDIDVLGPEAKGVLVKYENSIK